MRGALILCYILGVKHFGTVKSIVTQFTVDNFLPLTIGRRGREGYVCGWLLGSTLVSAPLESDRIRK